MDRDITHLHPDLQPLCREFLDRCMDEGIDVKVIYTYRSPKEQDDLYAIGRTKPGRRVTNLKGGDSKHNFTMAGSPASKAFDFGVYQDGKYIQNGSHPLYQKAGEIGESLGLIWGGRWKELLDAGHLQLKG